MEKDLKQLPETPLIQSAGRKIVQLSTYQYSAEKIQAQTAAKDFINAVVKYSFFIRLLFHQTLNAIFSFYISVTFSFFDGFSFIVDLLSFAKANLQFCKTTC